MYMVKGNLELIRGRGEGGLNFKIMLLGKIGRLIY